MTPGAPEEEGFADEIEDLVAPAEAIGQVFGGRNEVINCIPPTCAAGSVTTINVKCVDATCEATQAWCGNASNDVVLQEK